MIDLCEYPQHIFLIFKLEFVGFVQLYKELSMSNDQKKLLRKMFQSFLDAVVELLQTEHGVIFFGCVVLCFYSKTVIFKDILNQFIFIDVCLSACLYIYIL